MVRLASVRRAIPEGVLRKIPDIVTAVSPSDSACWVERRTVKPKPKPKPYKGKHVDHQKPKREARNKAQRERAREARADRAIAQAYAAKHIFVGKIVIGLWWLASSDVSSLVRASRWRSRHRWLW